MLFASVTACNYHAREIVRRYGHLTSPKHFALAYCVPRFLERTRPAQGVQMTTKNEWTGATIVLALVGQGAAIVWAVSGMVKDIEANTVDVQEISSRMSADRGHSTQPSGHYGAYRRKPRCDQRRHRSHGGR